MKQGDVSPRNRIEGQLALVAMYDRERQGCYPLTIRELGRCLHRPADSTCATMRIIRRLVRDGLAINRPMLTRSARLTDAGRHEAERLIDSGEVFVRFVYG